jgi:hypothetical protein
MAGTEIHKTVMTSFPLRGLCEREPLFERGKRILQATGRLPEIVPDEKESTGGGVIQRLRGLIHSQ